MALLLLKLGKMIAPRSKPFRFVASHSANAWLALLIAVYLQRVHGGELHGLLTADGKSEWMHAGDVRTLMRQVGLSYRMTARFDALAELALLSVNPAPNRLIMPAAFTPARAILPRRWEGAPPPFAACVRIGTPLDVNALLADFGRLGEHCETFAYWSGPPGGGERLTASEAEGDEASSADVQTSRAASSAGSASSGSPANGAFFLSAFEKAAGHGVRASAHRAGNWTVLKRESDMAPVRFRNDYVDPPPPPPPPSP